MKKKKRLKQMSVPGTDTPLSKAVDAYIDNKMEIAELKVEQDAIATTILEEMKKAKLEMIKVEHSGERFILEVLSSDERIRVAKDSKTPTSEAELNLEEGK